MEATLFKIGLYSSLAICAAGMLYGMVGWFRLRLGPDARRISTGERVLGAVTGTLRALCSAKFLRLLSSLLLDVLLQRRLWRADRLRWLAHSWILGGFCALLLMHALETQISARLFAPYQSTLNPFLWLRDGFGVLVLLGVLLLLARRLGRRRARPSLASSAPRDRIFGVLVLLVMLSGFLLKGAKISSEVRFFEMTE